MKVVVAIDSLKGSMSSMEAGRAIEEGIRRAVSDVEVIVKPLADGGEGTTEAFVEGMGGEMRFLDVMGPLGEKQTASYGYLAETKTAIIEMASSSGIILVPREKLNPKKATTYGVGELIKDAIAKGCREFIIGIGGSATNDCGIGMLSALGFTFYDSAGNPVGISGDVLKDVAKINLDNAIPELQECHFKIACDVTSPLCGPTGATYIFGPQKGVTPDMLVDFDKAHANFAKCTREATGKDCMDAPGAGAAGGLGFAFLSYLNSELERGIDLVINAVGLEECLIGADIVVTGEGCLDHQTAMGKVPVGIAKLARKHGAVVIAFAGCITPDAPECNEAGIHAYFPILPGVLTLEEAMQPENARKNMANTAEQAFRLIQAMK
ncbi:glycerate kinase [Bacteroidia bacterium]|nr:glycerate kinase [Bacteroidia bacterium]